MTARFVQVLLFGILPVLSLTSCLNKIDDDIMPQQKSISGVVQKGPFINGSSVTIYELTNILSPTGMSYNAEIEDNKGTFNIGKIYLSSNYIKLKADGYYYNEVSGKLSSSQLTLYALADVAANSAVNVNVLTHLEKARVEYLIKDGATFAEAKAQAQKEILAVFNIEKPTILSSENLSIASAGDDNAILLAVSSILQGTRSEGELTDLMSKISNDLKVDGILNDASLGSALVSDAAYLDTTQIKLNMNKLYSISSAGINQFGKYIHNFVVKTKFKPAPSVK